MSVSRTCVFAVRCLQMHWFKGTTYRCISCSFPNHWTHHLPYNEILFWSRGALRRLSVCMWSWARGTPALPRAHGRGSSFTVKPRLWIFFLNSRVRECSGGVGELGRGERAPGVGALPGPEAPRRLCCLIQSTICSPTLVSWSRDATLRLVITTNTTGTSSILSSCGPSPAKVGGVMNTNSPTDVSLWGFSDSIVCASIFFHCKDKF